MLLCARSKLTQKCFWGLLTTSLILPGGFWLQKKKGEPLSYIEQPKHWLLRKNNYEWITMKLGDNKKKVKKNHISKWKNHPDSPLKQKEVFFY